MAPIRKRRRRDGTFSYAVLFRAGGLRDAKQESEVFEDETSARSWAARSEAVTCGHTSACLVTSSRTQRGTGASVVSPSPGPVSSADAPPAAPNVVSRATPETAVAVKRPGPRPNAVFFIAAPSCPGERDDAPALGGAFQLEGDVLFGLPLRPDFGMVLRA
ncbi:hypothetical protein [Streptomyces sp. BBFR102]|uniref:hypothetical protein n=1 Tax=Streptomyces sp. BBFR102 TaxID=3448171 RepID=UPI003F52ED36